MSEDIESKSDIAGGAFLLGLVVGILVLTPFLTWLMVWTTCPQWLEDKTKDRILIICEDGSTEWQSRPYCEKGEP